MSTLTVLQLSCPGCGGTLHGSPQGILFWCESCHAIQEVVEDRFVSRPCQTARPALPGSVRLCHLPVWAFRVRASWRWPERAKGLGKGWLAPDWVYVTAFALSNGFYFGDPGVIFTQKRLTLTPADPAPLIGGARSLREAEAFVRFHLLAILDRREDITGLQLDLAIGDAVLWGIPYYDDGLTLVDGMLGLRMPGAALDEIAALRAWWEWRR